MPETAAGAGRRSLPLLDYLARLSRRAVEASLPPDGLRSRHLIALHLLSERGPLTQHGLGEMLSLDPSNVVGLLNELEERGLIVRRRDRADRRRHIVELAPCGERELEAEYRRLAVIEERLLGSLTPAERDTLYQLLARAVSAKSAPCGAPDPAPCLGVHPEGSPAGRP